MGRSRPIFTDQVLDLLGVAVFLLRFGIATFQFLDGLRKLLQHLNLLDGGRCQPAGQRFDDHQIGKQEENGRRRIFDQGLVVLDHIDPSDRLRRSRHLGWQVDFKGNVHHFDFVSPAGIVVHGTFNDVFELGHLFGGSRHVLGLFTLTALFRLLVTAVHDHGNGKSLYAADGHHLTIDQFSDLVVLGELLFLIVAGAAGAGGAGVLGHNVGLQAGNTGRRSVRIVGDRAGGLFAANDRVIGQKKLFGGFLLGKIEQAGYPDNGLVQTQHALKHRFHPIFQQTFFFLLKGQLVGSNLADSGFLLEPGQHLAAVVDNGDILGIQAGYAGRNQVDNPLYLAFAQEFAPSQLEDHRCRGRFVFFDEKRSRGHDDVNPGTLHLHEGIDGTAQFTLQRSLVIHILNELGHAQFGIVKHLETDAGSPRHSQRSQLQTRFIDFFIGNPHTGAVHGQLVRNLILLQFGYDISCIFRCQIIVKRMHVAAFRPGQ